MKHSRQRRQRQQKRRSYQQRGGAGEVDPFQQWDSPFTSAPAPQLNAGLYTGAPASGPWGNIPVTPTGPNMTHNNLVSAEPPMGAVTQYVGSNRLGNNFRATPGVETFPGSNILCTTGGGRRINRTQKHQQKKQQRKPSRGNKKNSRRRRVR